MKKWICLFLVFVLVVGSIFLFGIPVTKANTANGPPIWAAFSTVAGHPGVWYAELYFSSNHGSLPSQQPSTILTVDGANVISSYPDVMIDLATSTTVGLYVWLGTGQPAWLNNAVHKVSLYASCSFGTWTWTGYMLCKSWVGYNPTAQNLLAVSVAGASTPLVQTAITYTATITGGITPYSRRWRVWRDGVVYYTGSWGNPGATLSYTFPDIHAYQVECEVKDAWSPPEDLFGYVNVQPYAATLTCSVSGEANPAVGVSYTYTATIGGGLTPYQTQWTVADATDRVIYTGAVGTATTFSYAFPAVVSTYSVCCQVTDALGTSVTGCFTVGLILTKPVLWAQIEGVGADAWIRFSLFLNSEPHGTLPVALTHAIQTVHYNVVDPATGAQGVNWYALSPGVPVPNPLVVTVDYVDPATRQGWHYTFSFNTTNLGEGSCAGSDGSTTQPGLPTWLQAVYDMLARLFKFLFIPTNDDFSKQLAGGWITITSPVPSIVPQYTIPFPNPNYMLAPTGDTVDISFDVRAISGYSIYQAIIQAVLTALLVYIALTLIT